MPNLDQGNDERTLIDGASAARRSRPLREGDIVGGSYHLVKVIGRGGMGVVYLADQPAVKRRVALKLLAPDRISQANWQRFEAEGKAISRLDHPNIVKVYDMGTDGQDCLYYVMDLLEGISLAELIRKKGTPNVAESLEIFGQIASGLAYAHRQGLIHRDVKPSNIILCPVPGSNRPLVKIIDYGLVKLTGEAGQVAQSQTATGSVFGSPFYMSPEQWQAKPVDERTDIYSLGCALFECLTGRPPFVGDNPLETAMMHQNDEPPKLIERCPGKDFPENLELMVNRMLQKQPSQRHQSMTQVSQDILRIKAGKSVGRQPVFADGPLFAIDDKKQANLEAPDRATRVPLAFFCILGAIVTLILAAAGYVSYTAWQRTNRENQMQIDAVSPNLKGIEETPELKQAREAFERCPQISNGVVTENGEQARVFNFPDVPIGYLCWGPKHLKYRRDFYDHEVLAKGKVVAPPAEALTLLLQDDTESQYTRIFPQILAKIGPQDISRLEVVEPKVHMDSADPIFTGSVTKGLVQAISKWTDLRYINFYHCKVPSDAVLALNCFSSIDELKLRDSFVASKDLAQVKWLKTVKRLDIKGMADVDLVLDKLAGSIALEKLTINMTAPSAEALKKLAACPLLVDLYLDSADTDDSKIAALSNISSLKSLDISQCSFSRSGLMQLAKLQDLKFLYMTNVKVTKEDADNFERLLPHCRVVYSGLEKDIHKMFN